MEGGPGGIAVTYEIASASDRLDVFVRALGLTVRESQLVRSRSELLSRATGW